MRKIFKKISAYAVLLTILTTFNGCKYIEFHERKDSNVFSESDFSVHFIDVGQGDSILVESGESSMLIDAGENNQGEKVVNYLKDQNIDKLDYIIGTHPHSDHIGGLDVVINRLDIGKIILPDVTNTSNTFQDMLDAISNKGLKVTKAKAGQEYSLGNAKFMVLGPNNSNYSDLNNYSVVVKVVYGDTSFLLTGDAEAISEREMIECGYDLSADVLKLGHHGSSYSSCEEFLDAVNPKYGVISVGEDNRYNHPAGDTLEKISDRGIALYRTDDMGTIVAASDGKDISFHQEKEN